MGAWPIIAVKTMARIIENTEDHGLARIRGLTTQPSTTGGAVTRAAAQIGEALHAKYLVVFTTSGDSARRMSRVRPALPMLAFSQDPQTRRRLALTWGIQTFDVPDVKDVRDLVTGTDEVLQSYGGCTEGDVVVIVAGTSAGVSGTTNMLQVHRVGVMGT